MLYPIEVSDVELAFGGRMEKLLPEYNEIPQEFKNGNTKWNKVVTDWFYGGLKNCRWMPKKGVDTAKAVRHIGAIMGSFEPSHEHKMAGCAYLLSSFFKDVKYDA
jgi:hypothetical protein